MSVFECCEDTELNYRKIIADLIRVRKEKGISQQKLGALTGIPQSSIARIEKMKVIPRLDTIIKIAEALNVELEIKR